jgi:predicted RNase H-like nuclease (RuvC/YqgF family)
MSKVLKQNAILGGQEFKAGTKENDLPADVKKMASQFLIDEKKYKSPVKSEKNELAEANIRFEESLQKLEEAESRLTEAVEYADKVDSSLSEANSEISGLITQLEDEKSRADDADTKLAEIEDNSDVADLTNQLQNEKVRADDAETRLSELEAAIVQAGGSVVRDEEADGSKVTVETAKEGKSSKAKDKK